MLLEIFWVIAPLHDLGQVISPLCAAASTLTPRLPGPYKCKIIRAGLCLSQTCRQAWIQDKTETFGSKNRGGSGEHKTQECFGHFSFENFIRKVFPTSLPLCGKIFIKLFHIWNIWEFWVSLHCLFPTLTQHRERGGKWGKTIKLKNNVGGRQNLMFPFNALELSKDEEVKKGWSSD